MLMNGTQFTANRLREVLLDGHWIANTNYRQQLTNTSWQQATQMVGSLNTIAALTYHINYYLAGLLQVLKGGKLEMSDKYSFDVPPITSEADWNHLVDTFLANAESFVSEMELIPETMLEGPFVEEKYGTWARNLEGVVEHSYYHLGQISLIKKLLQA